MADQADGKVAAGLVTTKLVTLKAQGNKVVQVNKWSFQAVMAVADMVLKATRDNQAAEKAGLADPIGWAKRLMGEGGTQAFEMLKLSVNADQQQYVAPTMDADDAFALIDAMEELNQNSGPLIKKACGLSNQVVGMMADRKS